MDQYNWDDGVEIPYFIMHHKNCDLALRKKLFELGAGDCIDEDTYKDINKDPWKRFIIELDEMIRKVSHFSNHLLRQMKECKKDNYHIFNVENVFQYRE